MVFIKGHSGHRPLPSVIEADQEDILKKIQGLSTQAYEALADLLVNPDVRPNDRLKAIAIVLERSFGKTPTKEVKGADPIDDLTDEELIEHLDAKDAIVLDLTPDD